MKIYQYESSETMRSSMVTRGWRRNSSLRGGLSSWLLVTVLASLALILLGTVVDGFALVPRSNLWGTRSASVATIKNYQCASGSIDRPLEFRRFASFHLGSTKLDMDDDDDEDDDDDDDDEVSSSTGRLRKRDRIKDWFSQSASSSSSSSLSGDRSSRIKAKFDNLFSGMPSMSDILSADATTTEIDDSSSKVEFRSRKQKKDPAWFEQEKKRIMDSFEEMLEEMMAKLEVQRQEDPESVPENAEGIIKSVLKQEMDTEIERAREALSLQRLQEYESAQRNFVDEKDISGPIDDEVQRLIDESEEEYSRKEESRLQLEEFLRYEAEAFRQAADQTVAGVSTTKQPDGDLDQWALERLQEMADSRQDVDGGEVVLDILDEIKEDLQKRMEKEQAKKGGIKTETLKEWQMYRAIATRLNKQRGESQDGSFPDNDDEQIERILGSWREYVAKEQKIRDEGGLSQTSKKQADSDVNIGSVRNDRQARAETRKKINKMSIEALESLMITADPARRMKLQSEIDFLKSELEGKDYLDFEEPEDDDVTVAVDMTGVFTSKDEAEKRNPRPAEERRRKDDRSDSGIDDYKQQQPSNTPVLSETEDEEVNTRKAPPPNTPFFSDGEQSDEAYTAPEDSKLGSFQEQKLASLYRRAGARTREEQERVRAGWEDYQRIEKEKRKLSGLDDSSNENVEYGVSPKFNVSDLMKEDGDFDAEKILSAIGPRPKRGTKRAVDTSKQEQKPGREEVVSSLYRSISAVGGDRFKDDPEAKAKDQMEFQAFLKKERELRRSLDETADTVPTESVVEDEDFDDEEYAEEVLSSLGPRPRPRRTSKVDPREFSDMGGVLSSEDDSDNDEDDESSDSLVPRSFDENPQIPEWLRRENEEAASKSRKTRKTFLGEEVEEAFDDDQYEKNMRQLAEYERRRAGKQASLGIDITDVLGRRDIDDYKDYMFDENMYAGSRRGWGVASFQDRKRNLIEYTELDLAEVNSLMDHRDSVHSTGVSQYTKRINKPFEAFGAIFRLEGVFADLSGMHERVWTLIAEKESLRVPSDEEFMRASVVHPEAAIREIFVWTDDFVEIGRLGRVFREEFSAIFETWAEENGLKENETAGEAMSEKGNLAIGEDLFADPQPSPNSVNLPKNERDLLELLFRVWSQIAFDHGKSVPTESQIQEAAMVSPDIAIQEVFRWTDDTRQIVSLEKEFQGVLRKLSGNAPSEKDTSDRPKERPKTKKDGGSNFSIDEASLMEAHYVSWVKVADKFGFEKPSPDEVLGAYVLNDPLIAARDGFAWTDDEELLSQVVEHFYSEVKDIIRSRSGTPPVVQKVERTKSISSKSESSYQPSPSAENPTFEEVLEMNKRAWAKAAASHGFNAPPEEFVKLSLNMNPVDVIAKIFRWTWDVERVERIAETFNGEIKKESEEFAAKYKLSLEQPASETERDADELSVSRDDLYQAALNAWTETAEVHNLPRPSPEQVLLAMSVGPEEAISTGFKWTEDVEAAWWIMETYKEKIAAERERLKLDEFEGLGNETDAKEKPLVSVIPGAYNWVKSLREYEMQCGVISHLSKEQVAILMKYTKLDELFGDDVRVTSQCGYKSDSQQMLGAALRLERRPDHCVVFDSSPYASVAAHELDMRSVGLIGSYPRYELLSADTTASGFQELTAFNIRRLFGERIFDQPELDRQQADPSYQKKVRTAFDWGDD